VEKYKNEINYFGLTEEELTSVKEFDLQSRDWEMFLKEQNEV
jgi:hypothetical protein